MQKHSFNVECLFHRLVYNSNILFIFLAYLGYLSLSSNPIGMDFDSVELASSSLGLKLDTHHIYF